jgi:hypothetical protein
MDALKPTSISPRELYHAIGTAATPLHFWANNDAKKLAEGLKAALAHINIAKS